MTSISKKFSPPTKISWTNSILTRTTALLLVLTLVPLIFIGGAAIYFVGQEAHQKAENALLSSCDKISLTIKKHFAELSEDIDFIASHFDQVDLTSKMNINFLAAFTSTHHDILNVWVEDKNGKVSPLYSREQILLNSQPINRTPKSDVMYNIRKVHWHESFYNAFGEIIVVGSIPIINSWQKLPAGTLHFEVNFQKLQNTLRVEESHTTGFIAIINDKGQLLGHVGNHYDKDQYLQTHRNLQSKPIENNTNQAVQLYHHTEKNGARKLGASQTIPDLSWTLVVEKSAAEVYAMRNKLIGLTAVSFLVLAIFLVPIALFCARRITIPINRLFNATQKLAEGDLCARAEIVSQNEIGALAQSFNLMAELRQKNEIALSKEKEQLAVTLKSIGDGVISTDMHGTVVLMNKVAETLTGWPLGEAIGQPINKVFHIINELTREPCENPVDKVIATGKIIGLANHTALISKDGTERSIADSGAPIYDAESKVSGVVLVFRDVTEKNKMEEEILKVKKLDSVGILAGGIAHDFNNILVAILGNLNLATQKMDPEDDIYTLLQSSEEASLRAKNLTQQLLTFSKGGEPVKETTKIAEVIKDSANFVLHGSNVACKYDISEDCWEVDIDKGQISQVIQNLVINAQNAMPEGGIIHVGCENVDDIEREGVPLPGKTKYIKITVTDDGIGIPAKILSKVFDPYFSTKKEGSGLGLAITHSIITKHHGHISVMSKPEEGATFTVFLPASTLSEEKPKSQEKSEPVSRQAKVMIMDDDAMVRNVAQSMLSHLGLEVVLAKDGQEAIHIYKENFESKQAIDIIIMDLTIPGGMGGKDAVKEVLAINPKVKVVVSSGYSNDPVMANFKDYGFCSALVKPFQLQKLSKVISQLLD